MSKKGKIFRAILLLAVLLTTLSAPQVWENTAEAANASKGNSGNALFEKALAAYQGQKMSEAAEAFGLAGAAYVKEKNNQKAAQCYYNQGLCQVATAQSGPALDAFEQASALYQKAKDVSGESNARLSAAQLRMAAMQWEKAAVHYERVMKIAGKTPLLRGLAQEGLGRVHREKGEQKKAKQFFVSAEKSFKDSLGSRLRVRLQLAFITALEGDVLEGLKMYDDVVQAAAKLQKDEKTRDEGTRLLFYAQSDKGTLLLKSGWFAEAQTALSEALETGEKLGLSHAPEILSARNNYAQTFL
ncbi:MAG: hypothetical protein LBO68_06540 [Synergistaceae bacterium]|jgi:tetratricopeptide (TPR) repeat protein|nr:hypothetical protein [Synergistaceae bacterium]